ncbi:hypothetical protein [Amycolatopsis plumensis]
MFALVDTALAAVVPGGLRRGSAPSVRSSTALALALHDVRWP